MDWFMDQSDGKAKVWRKKDLLMIPNIQAHLKHSGGNVMAWACIASSGTGSLIFINDVTHDGSSKLTQKFTEIFCLTIYRKMQPNWLWDPSSCSKIITQNIVPKQQRSSSGQEVKGFRLASQSPDLNPIEHAFYLLKKRLKGVTPQNWKRLRWKPGKASQKKNAKVWWCQWVTGLMQLLKAKDLQLNIKSFAL